MRLTDTHCHLYFRQYQADLDQVLSRAEGAGIDRILVPGVDLETSQQAVELAESQPKVYCGVGVHPNSGLSWTAGTRDALRELSSHPKVVAVGEIGLDYYRQQAPPDLQKRILGEQLELAADIGKPVILHVRNRSEQDRQCLDDLLDLLEEWTPKYSGTGGVKPLPGVIHSFSGNVAESGRAVRLGFYLGIVGFVTYQNAETIREVIRDNGISRLLVETDGPFIAPHPYRGKRNEPAHVRYIVDKISEITGLPGEQVAAQTTANADSLFKWE